MAKYQWIVFSEALPGRDDDYNQWYENQHFPDILRTPGVLSGQRFRVEPNTSAAQPRYVAIYEVETDDTAAFMAAMVARAGTPDMPLTDSINSAAVQMTFAAPLGKQVPAEEVRSLQRPSGA
jgi:hypothetical protein